MKAVELKTVTRVIIVESATRPRDGTVPPRETLAVTYPWFVTNAAIGHSTAVYIELLVRSTRMLSVVSLFRIMPTTRMRLANQRRVSLITKYLSDP